MSDQPIRIGRSAEEAMQESDDEEIIARQYRPVSRVVSPEPRLIRADDVDASCDLDFGTCREAFPKDSASWCHGCVIAGLLAERETARQQLNAWCADATRLHQQLSIETAAHEGTRQQLDALIAAFRDLEKQMRTDADAHENDATRKDIRSEPSGRDRQLAQVHRWFADQLAVLARYGGKE